jgi:ribosomal protein L16 Arg81 hydroxylase
VRVAASEIPMGQVYSAFCEGYSMRLGGVHRFCPSLAGLRAALSERLSARIRVELYLTPASTQGVTAHYDNRDSFILQIHGSKRWHLGEPIYELPGLAVNHVADRIPDQLIENDSPHLADSVVVKSGDLLYLPRGFYHQPVAENETSLHLSVAVYPLSWGDFLTRAIELMALHHRPLRRALPPGFASGRGASDGMAEAFSELVEAVAQGASFENTLDALIREQRDGAPDPSRGHLASLDP